MGMILSESCSPDEVIFGGDFHQSLYCHLLCGLVSSPQVQFVSSTFSHGIVHAFRTFELVWEDLCHDIHHGVLSRRITVPSMRDAVSNLFLSQPNPELAAEIHGKCRGLKGTSNWKGLVTTLWPNAMYVMAIMTGSMEPYLKKLRDYAGDLPLVATEYGSSEGWIGANVNPRVAPELARFAVLPDIGYFEFIPLTEGVGSVEAEHEEGRPLGLGEVEIGRTYEIVMTTFAGLYRYRLGDVVVVAGFHNSTPELQFVCRRNLLLNLHIDKNSERDLQMAVEEAAKLLDAEEMELIDFTSCVEDGYSGSEPGHYVVFWELSSEPLDREHVLDSCVRRLDGSFRDPGYVSSRRIGTIGPLELRVVTRGTFDRIMEHYLRMSGAVTQFKLPRCVPRSNQTVIRILCDAVVGSFFSVAYG